MICKRFYLKNISLEEMLINVYIWGLKNKNYNMDMTHSVSYSLVSENWKRKKATFRSIRFWTNKIGTVWLFNL